MLLGIINKFPSKRFFNRFCGISSYAKNPYFAQMDDDRFSKYKAIMFRAIDSDSEISGPASFVFPGMPMSLYNRGRVGFLAIVGLDEVNHSYLHDTNTALFRGVDLNWGNYPCISAPSLLFLYSKYLEHNDEVVKYNETLLHKQEDLKPAILHPSFVEELAVILHKHHIFRDIPSLFYYNELEGRIFQCNQDFVLDENVNPHNVEQFIQFFDENIFSGKLRITNEVSFGEEVLTIDNLRNHSDMQDFARDSYFQDLIKIAQYCIIQEGKKPFNDHLNSQLFEILMRDVELIIKVEGEKEIMDYSPRSSIVGLESSNLLSESKKELSDLDIDFHI